MGACSLEPQAAAKATTNSGTNLKRIGVASFRGPCGVYASEHRSDHGGLRAQHGWVLADFWTNSNTVPSTTTDAEALGLDRSPVVWNLSVVNA
jgi:hypothetical protein